MAANVLADSGFLVAILTHRDSNHRWANTASEAHPPPWKTCEAALSEAFHLLAPRGASNLAALLRRRAVICMFSLEDNKDTILSLMQKYADVPMSFADACLVRMSELLPDPIVLTTDADFRVYRRNNRQIVPCAMPQ